MSDYEKVTLDLNQEICAYVNMRLEQFSAEHPVTKEHPLDYAEIICDVKELVVQLVRIIYHYLHRRGHPAANKKTADITMTDRKTVYNYVNK